MVDVGGGARESFQSLCMDEPDAVLGEGKESYYSHPNPHHTPSPSSSNWRHALLGEGPVVECIPPDTLHIKNDPENLVSMCSSPDPGTEAVEDARARGRLLQEITRVAETFEPYATSATGYRSYGLPPEASTDPEFILSDAPQWSWNRSPSEDRSLGGPTSASLLTGTAQQGDAAMNSLQYGVASQLIPDAFSSLPPLSVPQSPTSVPSCSSRDAPVPSALDLSPGPHQLPLLQPTNVTPASTHMVVMGSSQQLEVMQPSLMALDLASHHNLDESLMVVSEGETRQTRQQCHETDASYTKSQTPKNHTKGSPEEVPFPNDKQEDSIQASADSHPKTTVQNRDKLFKCTRCDQAFSKAERLKTHEQTHTGEKPYKCDECGITFLAKAMLIRHRKVHTGEKPYKCDVCATFFTESGSLKVHKRLHSGEKPFKCDVCNVAFNGAGMLATHKRKHTGEKPYMCDECGKTFRLLSTLKSHRRRHTGERPFSCEVCGSSFAQRAAMQRHKRIHSDHKPWQCEQCGYKFREKENLRKHVELHKIKLQHLCTVCGAGFNQAKKLETHKMLHNGGDRPYQCNRCPSTFTNPKYLTQHKKRVHDKKGTLRCEECHGTFKRKESLRSHMRIHMGVRPFVCPECGAAFNQRGSLTKHVRIHGDDGSSHVTNCNSVGRKTCSGASFIKSSNNGVVDDIAEQDLYSCNICSDHFPTHKELVYHKRSNHAVQKSAQPTEHDDDDDDSSEHIRDKYVCEDCDQTFFRKRQLRAHKKYCPCSCSTYQTEPVEEVPTLVTSSLHSEPKEVDAMKLLTAALGVTGNDCNPEITQHPHSPRHYHSPSGLSPDHYQCHSPLSPHHYTPPCASPHQLTSPSLHVTTSTTMSAKNEQHCQDLFTFTTSSSSPHQIHYSLTRQEIDHLQLPQQQLMHLPHLCTQQQDSLHQPSDHLQQLMQQQQNALKQLSEDNILKLAEEHSQQQQTSPHMQPLSSYVQQTGHQHTSRYSYYSQSHDPPQDPASQHHDASQYITQHTGDLHQCSRQCSDIPVIDQVNQNSKHQHVILPQESVRQQKHLPQTTRQHQQHIQTRSGQSGVVNRVSPSVQPPVINTSQHEQSGNQHHLPIDSVEEQPFYKDASLSGEEHFPHHHQSLHLGHNLPQSLAGSEEDCDDLTSTLHPHSHTQHHQLQQEDLYQSEEENQMEMKQHYQDHHHPLLSIHHSHQHFKVEDPYDVTVKNELVSHTYP